MPELTGDRIDSPSDKDVNNPSGWIEPFHGGEPCDSDGEILPRVKVIDAPEEAQVSLPNGETTGTPTQQSQISITNVLETEVKNSRLPSKIHNSKRKSKKIEHGLSSDAKQIAEYLNRQIGISRLSADLLSKLDQENAAPESRVESWREDLARERKMAREPKRRGSGFYE